MKELQAEGGAFVEALLATRTAMVVTDPKVAGNPIIHANAAFLELCGYAADQVLGQNYLFLMRDAPGPAMAKRVKAAMTASHDINEAIQFPIKGGRTIWVSAFISAMSEVGAVVRHFVSFLEVTDRLVREEGQRELKDSLERRRRAEAVLRDALAQRQEDIRYRDFLIREVHHRTKNAFQLGISLLSVQAQHLAPPGGAQHRRSRAQTRLSPTFSTAGSRRATSWEAGSGGLPCGQYPISRANLSRFRAQLKA